MGRNFREQCQCAHLQSTADACTCPWRMLIVNMYASTRSRRVSQEPEEPVFPQSWTESTTAHHKPISLPEYLVALKIMIQTLSVLCLTNLVNLLILHLYRNASIDNLISI